MFSIEPETVCVLVFSKECFFKIKQLRHKYEVENEILQDSPKKKKILSSLTLPLNSVSGLILYCSFW